MAYRYRHHYTPEEARALLPQIRLWLAQLQKLSRELNVQEERLDQIKAGGHDLGGPLVNSWTANVWAAKKIVREFVRRDIEIKDVDRGLVDFPAIRAGREVFLCWELDDDDIEFWHDLDAGYAGRERL